MWSAPAFGFDEGQPRRRWQGVRRGRRAHRHRRGPHLPTAPRGPVARGADRPRDRPHDRTLICKEGPLCGSFPHVRLQVSCRSKVAAVPKLIIVSNRLPVQLDDAGTLVRSSGGLASAMAGLGEADQCWVGWPGQLPADGPVSAEDLTRKLRQLGCEPVLIDDDALYERYYAGYANSTLWPLLHYMTQLAAFEPDWFSSYEAINARFADVVLSVAEPGDRVWVHDYQLMLLPQMLRARRPDLRIGYFLHVPFPSYEVFRVLPDREALLRGIVGADQIGFHTFGYLRHFRSALLRGVDQESMPDAANRRRAPRVARRVPHRAQPGGLRRRDGAPRLLRARRDPAGRARGSSRRALGRAPGLHQGDSAEDPGDRSVSRPASAASRGHDVLHRRGAFAAVGRCLPRAHRGGAARGSASSTDATARCRGSRCTSTTGRSRCSASLRCTPSRMSPS